MRSVIIPLSIAILACSGPHDWSSTRQALKRLLPTGSSAARVSTVLDSLGFTHTRLESKNSIIKASKREPPSNKLVWSTLQLVLVFDDSGRLVRDSSYEVFTGP